MLKNTPVNNMWGDKKTKIAVIIIGLICAVAIIITVTVQINQLLETPTQMEKSEGNIIEFNSLFDNKLNQQGYTLSRLEKLDDEQNVVYTSYEQNEKVDGKYDINIKIPVINLDNTIIKNINKEIEDVFREKARNIIREGKDYEVIYNVEYTAYINSNILSIAIKSNLKEGANPQRVILQTYSYNMTTNELLDIDKIIAIKQLNKRDVQNEINNVVAENSKQAQSLLELGYKVYERNLSDDMYKVENTRNFFYGPDGVLYIIYAYGNNNYTSELDIIPIN